MEVEALAHRLNAVLALGQAVGVVRALEVEAQTLGDEADMGDLAPAEEEEGDLAEAIVLLFMARRQPLMVLLRKFSDAVLLTGPRLTERRC